VIGAAGVGLMESVLVVDDEADILKLISENLMIRGYKVAEAQNAETAMQRLHEELPSLMVLDIKLPDSTGWELLEQVKGDAKIKADFPVLIMTASITEANIDRRNYPNVVDILIKPFSTTTLITAIKRSLNQ
jgi:CheY-like chemotaxis protein